MREESLVGNERFRFDYYRCLRSEYAKNDCRLCIDICPEEAMVFDRKKLTLDPRRCIACGVCMGVCPTQAFEHEDFDPDRFVLTFAAFEEASLRCGDELPCLAALSAEHLALAALRKEGPVVCEVADCKDCALNRDGALLKRIVEAAEEANRFVALIDDSKGVRVAKEPLSDKVADTGRRDLLRRLARVGDAQKLEAKEAIEADLAAAKAQEKVPAVRTLLKQTLKSLGDALSDRAQKAEGIGFVSGKQIDGQTCTNCQECAMFCPTEALSTLQDNTGIIFQAGKCIACGICNDVCQPRSINDDDTFNAVDFAVDRMALLVKHTLEICEECKVAFPYRGGEKICDRCRDFKANFSDLFTLAKDL